MSAGSKLSRGLMKRLAALDADAVTDLAARVLDVVRREAGEPMAPGNAVGSVRFRGPDK